MIDFDMEQFEELCKIQCTEVEIAAVLKMSVDTLARRVFDIYGCNFADIYAQKREGGRSSLRRAQWQTAIETKNPIMQIFLGKNILGQKDTQDINNNITGEGFTIFIGGKPAEDDPPDAEE